MRNFGNGIKNWYGELNITALSGIALTASGTATASPILQISGVSTNTSSYLQFLNSTNSAVSGIGMGAAVTGQGVSDLAIYSGAGNVIIGRSGGSAVATTFGPNGNVTIAAPNSGPNTLQLNGLNGLNTLGVQGSSVTNDSFGVFIQAGTSASDYPLLIESHAGTQIMQVYGDGGVVIGSSGTDEGAGTLNVATGLYVNGNQLFFGVPASSSTTAAVTDVGKCINATGTITIPNAVFSQGHALSIYNNSSSSITISAGITTMRLAGTATTGSRTLAQRGLATIWFESGTECVVMGSGVT
jgi:hypothetical protein